VQVVPLTYLCRYGCDFIQDDYFSTRRSSLSGDAFLDWFLLRSIVNADFLPVTLSILVNELKAQ
jgi:hypothetical protein